MRNGIAKKTPLWGKIAVTVMAVLVLGAAMGSILGFIWNYVICGGVLALIDLAEGFPMIVVLRNYAQWWGVHIDTWDPLWWQVLTAIMNLMPKLIMFVSDVLMVLGCVLFAVNLWTLSNKRAGNALSVVSMGLVAMGCGIRGLNLVCGAVDMFVSNVIYSGSMTAFTLVICAVCLLGAAVPAAFALILFMPALFGCRPKWLWVPWTALAAAAWWSGSILAIVSNVFMMIVSVVSYFLPALVGTETGLAEYIGTVPHAAATTGLICTVALACLVYVIVARFPSPFRKKSV